jgi:hypothetical protein
MSLSRLLCPIALALAACAEDLKTNNDGDGSGTFTIETESKADGVRETRVNASDREKYWYFDLDEPAEVKADSDDWDLAFQRFKIKTNGGDSGEGDVIGARVADVEFEDLQQAPDSGYYTDSDAIDPESEGGDPSYVFLGAQPWYSYEGMNHQLTPADAVYVVRSTKGDFFKVAMLGYYDAVGTAGYPRFQWAKLDAPDGDVRVEERESQADAGTPDAGGGDTSGCYNLSNHTCDCDGDEAACREAKGTWTPNCGCGKAE